MYVNVRETLMILAELDRSFGMVDDIEPVPTVISETVLLFHLVLR